MTAIRRAAYRVRQFFRALLATLLPPDDASLAAARAFLPEPGWALFRSMPRSDQRHSLDVYRALVDGGHSERALIQAALLHDAGKSGSGITLLHRVAIVLLKQFRPSWLAAWTRGEAAPAARWQEPLWAYMHHPETGAEKAAEAGCDPSAVTLIRHHQDHGPALRGAPEARWLALLQAADDDN